MSSHVHALVPENGHILILYLTDRQFGMTQNYYGGLAAEMKAPEQGLLLF
jgi:CRISPR/Cas system-associated protein endoribonuclease Cas2